MILAQRQDERRNRLANLAYLRRFVGHSYHVAALRVVLLLGVLLVVVTSERSAVGLLFVLPAIVGLVLHYLGMAAVSYDGTNWLLRRYEVHLARTNGLPKLNLAAILEIWGSIAAVAMVGHVITDVPTDLRLLGLACAVGYMCTVSYAIFDDSAWYNPDVRAPRWQELSRMLSGPQVVVLVLLIAGVLARWEGPGAYRAVVIIASYGLIVPVVLMCNQFLTSHLDRFVERERQHGTGFVIEQTRQLLEPLREARRLAEEVGQPQTAALATSAIESVLAIPQHVGRADQPADPPPLSTVADRLKVLVESAGGEISSYLPATLAVSGPDRQLAALIMRDLVGNAINARSSHIGLTVNSTGNRINIEVTDDGVPMPSGAWRAPGTSSALLEARLRERDGWLRVNISADQTKAVVANWLRTP